MTYADLTDRERKLIADYDRCTPAQQDVVLLVSHLAANKPMNPTTRAFLAGATAVLTDMRSTEYKGAAA